jgi:hypothetical protein
MYPSPEAPDSKVPDRAVEMLACPYFPYWRSGGFPVSRRLFRLRNPL